MKTIRNLACASVLCGLTAVSVAQEAPQEPTTTTVAVKTTKLKRIGGDVVGKVLVTPKNEPLGKVEDVIIHPRGDVAFVEVSGNAALNTGTSRFGIPWRALDHNEHDQFVLATTPEQFVKFRHYDAQKADLSDMSWWKETEKNYAKILESKATPMEASASLAPAKMLYRGSELRARTVENPDGTKIATISELVIDPRVGRVAYAVLAVGGTAGAGEKMIAVPWEAVKSMPDKANPKIERLTLATTKEQLEAAPEFQATTEGWAKASEPDYVIRVYEHYAMPPYAVERKVVVPK